MMKRFFLTALFIGSAFCGFTESFRFLYFPGEKYRILSTVREDVFLGGRFDHKAEILNRITVETTETKDGSGHLSCTFQTSEESRSATSLFSWGQMYESRFWRDARGAYTIGAEYYMPIVRNVPLFPERSVAPGDTWTGRGEEVHDFRTAFGLDEAVRFPIDVLYRYEGKESKEGKDYDVIGIEYTVFHRPVYRKQHTGLHPVRISGVSKQRLFWDARAGRPFAYEESFDFVFQLSNGLSVEYAGTAEAKVVESSRMEKETVAREIKENLADLGVRDTEVKVDDLGVTLTLENIRFPPDSAFLVPEEKAKLDRIGEILEKYPDRDILVSGHTALAGTAEGRKKLSEERAAAVGNYLFSKGVRTKERMTFRGLGASVPVADNDTAGGREKNRRVEITILEN